MYFGANPVLANAVAARAAAARGSMVQPMANGLPLPVALRPTAQQTADQRLIEQLVNPEVWVMYDTAFIAPAASAANYRAYASFATVAAQTSFFAGRTLGVSGAAVSSVTTNSGYVDFPFKAFGMGVEVFCDIDAPATASQFTSRQFVESVVNGGAIVLQFSTDPKLVVPISDMPAGGGITYGNATDSRALAANQTAGSAGNGFQSVQARVLWKDYILFSGLQTPFNLTMFLAPHALARIQALEPLTGNFSAGVRVKFWGYRGKKLITGSAFRG